VITVRDQSFHVVKAFTYADLGLTNSGSEPMIRVVPGENRVIAYWPQYYSTPPQAVTIERESWQVSRLVNQVAMPMTCGGCEYELFVGETGQGLFYSAQDYRLVNVQLLRTSNGYVPQGRGRWFIPNRLDRLEQLQQVTALVQEPPATALRWQVSADNMAWQVWDGTAWRAAADQGMTTSQLQAVPQSAWQTLLASAIGRRGVWAQATLTSSDETQTPHLTQLAAVEELPSPPTINSLACPSSAYPSSMQYCQITASSDRGTLTYSWETTSGQIQSSGATASWRVGSEKPSSGVARVLVQVSYQENPDVSASTTADIPILDYPLPQVTELTCPDERWITQPGTCRGTASAEAGTLKWQWSLSVPSSVGTITSTSTTPPATATLTVYRAGTVTVTMTAYIDEQPERQASLTKEVVIKDVPITGTISCPPSLMKRQTGTCEARFTTPYGSLNYMWGVTAQLTIADGQGTPVLSIQAQAPGQASVSLRVVNTLASSATASQTVTVPVYSWQAPVLTITGPSRVIRGQSGTLAATVKIPNNLPPGAPVDVALTWQIGDRAPEPGGFARTVTLQEPGQQTVSVTARFTAAGDDPDAAITKSVTVEVIPYPAPSVFIQAPRVVLVGRSLTATASARAWSDQAPPVQIQWTLPDGSRASGSSVTVVCSQAGDCPLQVVAWHEGYDRDEERGRATATIRARDYQFPTHLRVEPLTERNHAAPLQALIRVDGNFRNSPLVCCSFTYDYGDGAPPETTVRSRRAHQYNRPGTYVPRVTVSDELGNTATIEGPPIVVEQPMPLQVTLNTKYSNAWQRPPVTVGIEPTIVGGQKGEKVTDLEWLVDGQSVGAGPRFRSLFTTPGDHQVRLVVTTTSQQTTADAAVRVNPNQKPVCQIALKELPPPAQPVTVRMQAVCRDPDGRITAYRWDLGEPQPVEGRLFVVRRFTEPGTYPVSLTVTDNSGERTTVTEQVVVSAQ
jgi:PKD repeat protein